MTAPTSLPADAVRGERRRLCRKTNRAGKWCDQPYGHTHLCAFRLERCPQTQTTPTAPDGDPWTIRCDFPAGHSGQHRSDEGGMLWRTALPSQEETSEGERERVARWFGGDGCTCEVTPRQNFHVSIRIDEACPIHNAPPRAVESEQRYTLEEVAGMLDAESVRIREEWYALDAHRPPPAHAHDGAARWLRSQRKEEHGAAPHTKETGDE